MELLSVWVRRNINRAIRRESPNQVLLAEKPKICVFYFRRDASRWLIVFILPKSSASPTLDSVSASSVSAIALVRCPGRIKDLIGDIQSVFTRWHFFMTLSSQNRTYKHIRALWRVANIYWPCNFPNRRLLPPIKPLFRSKLPSINNLSILYIFALPIHDTSYSKRRF